MHKGTTLCEKLKDLSVSTQSTIIDGDLAINIKMTSPSAPENRQPISIICVLDISGSMDTEATQGGAVESDGFSRLDLVKHSVNTIISSLSDHDTLGIVTFSDNARVDFQLAEMKQDNKQKALQMISKMRTEGSTNLWDGIRLGLQLSKNEINKYRNTFVVVLSDGEPNQHPPNGQLATAIQYVKNNPLSASMSMFGYGYSLDTQLLSALTQLGGGCFGYIPDCSMIGTIFVNFLSSALASFSPKLQLKAHVKNAQMSQFYSTTKTTANLGTVQYGVSRSCLLRFKGKPQHEDLGTVQVFFQQNSRQKITVNLTNKIQGDADNVKIQYARSQHIKAIQNALQNSKTDLKACQQLMKLHLQKLKSTQQSLKQQSKYLNSLIRDIESDSAQQGQIMIALSKVEYWQKWGKDYFPALKIGHENEMCTNFKDPGLQLYGGQLFRSLQGTIDTVFIHLPPPIPSIKKYDANGNLKVVADMSDYYDQYGGCIYGQCFVQMADGGVKKIKQLKQGEQVKGLNGATKIKCIVKTQVNEQIQIVQMKSGLIITKYHPIFINGKWAFPINQGMVINKYIDAYYNFVMEDGHSMIVNLIPCITLGHGFQEQVAQHDYFGTNSIIEDLQKVQGWRNGYIEVSNKAFKRDPVSHKVIGMIA